MADIAMDYVCNINLDTLKHILKTFKAVEHRLEYVRTINDIIIVFFGKVKLVCSKKTKYIYFFLKNC